MGPVRQNPKRVSVFQLQKIDSTETVCW